MVLAEFLNTNLLEPLKQRLRDEGYAEGVAQGHAEGRAEGIAQGHSEIMAMVRSQLLENGINPDALFPVDMPEASPEKPD